MIMIRILINNNIVYSHQQSAVSLKVADSMPCREKSHFSSLNHRQQKFGTLQLVFDTLEKQNNNLNEHSSLNTIKFLSIIPIV